MSSLLWPMAFTLPNGLRAANDSEIYDAGIRYQQVGLPVGLSYVFGSIRVSRYSGCDGLR